MSKEYDLYLKEHRENVMQAFAWIRDNISNNFILYDPDLNYTLLDLIEDHDKSKYSANEYLAYDRYFYGEDLNNYDKKEFDNAWLHHIHNNPHHWQHWILFEDDPESGKPYKCLNMPFVYIVEMICDWWSFSWKQGNLFELFTWYDKHKDTMKLHPYTRKTVENLLEEIRVKLEEGNE